jgi:hypothetical protein
MNKMMQDQNGNKSSKRLAGISLLAGGGILGVTLFIYSLNKTVADPETASGVYQALLVAGGSLLGVGVFEFFKK